MSNKQTPHERDAAIMRRYMSGVLSANFLADTPSANSARAYRRAMLAGIGLPETDFLAIQYRRIPRHLRQKLAWTI